MTGERDHREQRPALPHERGELEAVRPGQQVDVGDHDVDVLGGEHGQRGVGAPGTRAPASLRSTSPVYGYRPKSCTQ